MYVAVKKFGMSTIFKNVFIFIFWKKKYISLVQEGYVTFDQMAQ